MQNEQTEAEINIIEHINFIRARIRHLIEVMENLAVDIAFMKGQQTQTITILNVLLSTLQKSYAGKVSAETRKQQPTNFIKLDDFAQMLKENPILYNLLRLKNKGLIEVLESESNQIQSNSIKEDKEQDKENKEESWY